MFVTDLRGLAAEQVAHWRTMYDQFGTRVQQSPAYAEAVSRVGERLFVAMGHGAIGVFTYDETTSTALCSDLPFLSAEEPGPEQLVAVVSSVRRATGLSVYLPLVGKEYADMDAYREVSTWCRLPNSVIDWSREGVDLWDRALSRGSSQLNRKRRLVQRDGLVLHTGESGHRAARDMLAVDDSSWKALCGQSMRQRESQWAVYSELVRSGVLTATFLRDRDRPVAFRLDGRVKDRVMCLKWSYDMLYKRYSPGLYLLTEGLTRQWSNKGIRTIDLFGSPDPLKDLLYSERRHRVDVWCGDPALGRTRAEDRLGLDARVTRARGEGKGLRLAFG
jgi:hypothetical protein